MNSLRFRLRTVMIIIATLTVLMGLCQVVELGARSSLPLGRVVGITGSGLTIRTYEYWSPYGPLWGAPSSRINGRESWGPFLVEHRFWFGFHHRRSFVTTDLSIPLEWVVILMVTVATPIAVAVHYVSRRRQRGKVRESPAGSRQP